MLEIDQEVDELCTSPEKKPTHDKMAKLLEMRSSLSQHAHVKGTPEDALWRDEVREQAAVWCFCSSRRRGTRFEWDSSDSLPRMSCAAVCRAAVLCR
jgi:hypothetical protein